MKGIAALRRWKRQVAWNGRQATALPGVFGGMLSSLPGIHLGRKSERGDLLNKYCLSALYHVGHPEIGGTFAHAPQSREGDRLAKERVGISDRPACQGA
jgi:hypothetical protein